MFEMETLIVKVGLLYFSTFSHFTPSLGYGTGAPSVACNDLLPKHGAPPQSSPSPYKVFLQSSVINVNTPLSIKLTSKSGKDEFKGFLVQVRRIDVEQNSNKPYEGGAFEHDPDTSDVSYARPLACSGMPNVAMTHSGPEPKKGITVRWVPNSPGQYRVYTTFVYNASTFWANQIDDQIIEVTADNQHQDSEHVDMANLCSTMKFHPSLEPLTEAGNPYTFMVGPAITQKSSSGYTADPHKIYQKEKMWINVTSEIGTPIIKMFLQVRSKASSKSKAVGKFVQASGLTTGGDYELVNCFGDVANGLFFVNRMYKKKQISDVSTLWEAPEDMTGDFEVVGTALSEEEIFWDKIGEDPEAARIKVLKSQSISGGNREQHGKETLSSAACSIFLVPSIFTFPRSFLFLACGGTSQILLLTMTALAMLR